LSFLSAVGLRYHLSFSRETLAGHQHLQGDYQMSTSQLPLSPDELFRQFRRGMLDPDTLHTQIILNLIELDEKLKAISALLEMALDVTEGLDVDVALLARHLQLPRPSQLGEGYRQNGTTGADEAEDEGSEEEPPTEE
jgi:hypothetical protein